MAYDEGLAARLDEMVPAHATSKKMFGGLCYLDRGNMACGIVADRLMLRLNNELADEARTEPFVAPMDFTGKPLRSMIYVTPDGIEDDRQLQAWVDRAFEFSATLPSK